MQGSEPADEPPLVIVGGGFSLVASAGSIFVGVVATCVGVAFLFSGSVVPLPMLLLGVALLYQGFRARRLRIVADETGVAVRNPYRSYKFSWDDVFDVDFIRSSAYTNREFTTGEPGSLIVLTTLDAGERAYKLAATFLPGDDGYQEQAARVARLRTMRKAYSTRG